MVSKAVQGSVQQGHYVYCNLRDLIGSQMSNQGEKSLIQNNIMDYVCNTIWGAILYNTSCRKLVKKRVEYDLNTSNLELLPL